MAIPVVLIVFMAISTLLTPPSTANDIMNPGDRLTPGQSLKNGNYEFIMQEDCNLVLYDKGVAKWATNTDGLGSACNATLLQNGNFVVNNSDGITIWSSKSGGKVANYVLVLQSDRNVVIYGPDLWATGTYITPAFKALGRKMGMGNGGDDANSAFVMVNSMGESNGSLIATVVSE